MTRSLIKYVPDMKECYREKLRAFIKNNFFLEIGLCYRAKDKCEIPRTCIKMATAELGIRSRDLKLDERSGLLPVCEVHMKQVFEMK